LQLSLQLGGQPLVVVVDERSPYPAAAAYSLIAGAAASQRLCIAEHPHPAVRTRQFGKVSSGAVARRIVDDEKLEIAL
jgi:hypothetical protein